MGRESLASLGIALGVDVVLGRQRDAASIQLARVWVLFALSVGKSMGIAVIRREAPKILYICQQLHGQSWGMPIQLCFIAWEMTIRHHSTLCL